MVLRPEAVVLSAQPFQGDRFKGGAERVAADIGRHMVALGWNCTWMGGVAWRDSVGPRLSLGEGIAGTTVDSSVLDGFAGYSTDPRGGRLPPAAVVDRVDAAQLVLVVDRAVGALPATPTRVLLLSNLAYANERQAARAEECDTVWVPSHYLAERLVAEFGWAPDDVRVVPPAVAAPRCTVDEHRPLARLEAQLAATGRPRSHRLLFPHRADPGKGLASAVRLLARLVHGDRLVAGDARWTLVITEANPDEGPAAVAVTAAAKDLARRLGVAQHLEWVPWLPVSQMPFLYALAGCTVVASVLEEGFGLVPVESVLAGVPVVTLGSGNLRRLATRLPGVHLVDVVDSERTAALVRAVCGVRVPADEVDAVRGRSGNAQQRAAVLAALGPSFRLGGAIPEPLKTGGTTSADRG